MFYGCLLALFYSSILLLALVATGKFSNIPTPKSESQKRHQKRHKQDRRAREIERYTAEFHVPTTASPPTSPTTPPPLVPGQQHPHEHPQIDVPQEHHTHTPYNIHNASTTTSPTTTGYSASPELYAENGSVCPQSMPQIISYISSFQLPSFFHFEANFIDCDLEARLVQLAKTECAANYSRYGRLAAQYGQEYNFKNRTTHNRQPLLDTLPVLFYIIWELIWVRTGYRATQCLILHYMAWQGIGFHKDDPYLPEVVIGISLNSESVIEFRKNKVDRHKTDWFTFALPPRSIYIFRNDLRHHWFHSILHDSSPGERIVMTFRAPEIY